MKDKGRYSIGTRIQVTVRVFPRARKQEIEELPSGELKLRVKSPPVKGRANREVIEVLSSYFRISSSRISIIRGEKSRLKLVSLEVDNKDLSRPIYQRYIQEGVKNGTL
ncbi:MAG: DUF167 domain-containing protein [Candidatus Aminicenantes bacterium]|nr:DUF167 domain-containing protein [Candidatus Aminicenantes bacterium]